MVEAQIYFDMKVGLRLSNSVLFGILREVQPRIIFKLYTFPYQTLSSGESSYLFSKLSLAPKPRELRSSGFHLLSVSKFKTHTKTRAFSIAVPTLWYSLTEHVK